MIMVGKSILHNWVNMRPLYNDAGPTHQYVSKRNQSRTNGPINAHLTIAQVMPKYNHNNEKQLEALLLKFRQSTCSSTAINSTTKLFVNAINMYITFNLLQSTFS